MKGIRKKAAELLGVSTHKLTTWVDRFNISYKNSKYLIESNDFTLKVAKSADLSN